MKTSDPNNFSEILPFTKHSTTKSAKRLPLYFKSDVTNKGIGWKRNFRNATMALMPELAAHGLDIQALIPRTFDKDL